MRRREGPAQRISRYQGDPVAFCTEVLGFNPWSKQRTVLESVRDHRRTAVRSGHSVGKTAVAARLVVWWLAVFPDSIAITTSATWGQVKEQLWREIASAHRSAKIPLGGELTDVRWELGPRWFGLGVATDQAENFAGYHSERTLVILDEASGVSEDVWEAAETLVASPDSRLLAVGNPTRIAGSFHRAFTAERDLYNTVAVSCFDAPSMTGERLPREVRRRLVSRDWIEGRRRAWGENSPLWSVRVLGDFPSMTDDTVVPLDELEAAQGRSLEAGLPITIGVDVARYGRDRTVIAVRTGAVVRIEKAYGGRDTMQTTGHVTRIARDLERRFGSKPRIVVDDTGVGGAVTDRLREIGGNTIVAFNAAGKSDSAEYPRKRDEAWFSFAELLPSLDLDPDPELGADLISPRYTLDSQGRRVVEPKDETRKRLHRSPDKADAVILACHRPRVIPPGKTFSSFKVRRRQDERRRALPTGFVHKGVGVADPALAEAPDPPPGWRYSKPDKRGYLVRDELLPVGDDA